MDEKALDALRNGLEDSYWYGDDDEKVFNELVRKAKAFDAYHDTIQSHLHLKGEPEFSNPTTEVLSDLIDIHDDYENKGDK